MCVCACVLLPAVIHTGFFLNVPGVPYAVPLHAAKAIAAEVFDAGLMGNTVDRSSVHGVGAAAKSAAAESTANEPQQQWQQSGYVRRGPVNEDTRQAAMSTGISAAAAGVGVVPNLKAAPPAGKWAGSKCSSKSAASGSAIAPPRVQALTSKTAKAIPALGTISNIETLWSFYTTGYNGGRAWRDQEKEGTAWRRNERKRWAEVKAVFDEIQFMACAQGIAPEHAATLLEQQRKRGKHNMPAFVKVVLPQQAARRKAAADGGPAAQAAAVKAVATAAQAAAEAAAAAAAQVVSAAAVAAAVASNS